MGLRDLLKKKDRLDSGAAADPETVNRLAAPEFTFIRSDTLSQEVIYPPTHPRDDNEQYLTAKDSNKPRRSLDVFRGGRSRGNSVSSSKSESTTPRKDNSKRLSERLHLSRSPSTSEYVPENLPTISVNEDVQTDKYAAESQWENRATILAGEYEKRRSHSGTPVQSPTEESHEKQLGGMQPLTTPHAVSSKAIDEDIQEAIRLHESGDLEKSTALFGRLADPQGANNPLSQVLYGLALRHGWGCAPDPERAITYLSAAASNSAAIEQLALQAGLKKGGAAKGELVLAIFELANCFRHGWGIPKDAVAAKQYYETAANLGDTDAMNEVAWCYLEGFGCKKDKFSAAKYYRLAEDNGNKTLGNSWIWKDKYNPPAGGGGKK